MLKLLFVVEATGRLVRTAIPSHQQQQQQEQQYKGTRSMYTYDTLNVHKQRQYSIHYKVAKTVVKYDK